MSYRILVSTFLGTATSLLLAQAPFTIIRPAEGARVREVVRVQLPKNSVPEGGYVAVWVHHGEQKRFLEATVPDAKGDVYEYLLDTKKLGIPDGPCKIEVVLYGPSGILDSSHVNVTVANRQEITVPKAGAVLKYRFRPNTSWLYDVNVTWATLSIAEEEEKRGATAAEQIVLDDRFQLEYAIYNVYPNGNGLLRVRAVPDESGTVVFQRLGGGFDIVTDDQLSPYFLELTPSGRTVYESGGMFRDPLQIGGDEQRHGVLIPLPILPADPQNEGDTWAVPLEFPLQYQGVIAPGRQTFAYGLSLPTSGKLVAFEWEQNRPCAHIRYEFAAGKPEGDKPLVIQGQQISDARVSAVQNVWFALDTGAVVKVETTFTVQAASTAPATTGQEPGAGRGTRGSRTALGPGPGPGPGIGPRGGEEEGPYGPGPGMVGPTAGPGGPGVAMGAGTGAGLPTSSSGTLRLRMRYTMVLRQ